MTNDDNVGEVSADRSSGRGRGARTAAAQTYPSRPVTFVVPFAPGGGTEFLARMLGQRLEQRLGKPFLIEHRPGAGGVTGAVAAARAAPDGHTILMAPSPVMAINVTLQEAALRSGRRLRAARAGGPEPLCPGGQPVAAGAFGGRPRQAGQAQPTRTPRPEQACPIIYSRNCSSAATGTEIAHVPYRGLGAGAHRRCRRPRRADVLRPAAGAEPDP